MATRDIIHNFQFHRRARSAPCVSVRVWGCWVSWSCRWYFLCVGYVPGWGQDAPSKWVREGADTRHGRLGGPRLLPTPGNICAVLRLQRCKYAGHRLGRRDFGLNRQSPQEIRILVDVRPGYAINGIPAAHWNRLKIIFKILNKIVKREKYTFLEISGKKDKHWLPRKYYTFLKSSHKNFDEVLFKNLNKNRIGWVDYTFQNPKAIF